MADEDDVGLSNSRRNRVDFTPATIEVAEGLHELLLQYQEHRKKQGKKRLSEGQRENYLHHIQILLLDLLSAWAGDETKFIGYSLGKENYTRGGSYWDHQRDEHLLSERIYRTLTGFLEEQGYIENHVAKPGYGGHSSRMRATDRLSDYFVKHELNWASIAVDPNAPVVIVKDKNKRLILLPEPDGFELEAVTNNLRRINANLQNTFINLNITDAEHRAIRHRLSVDVTGDEEPREPLEFSNRSLRRVFANGGYENGGRFYGGWWQGLPSEYRKHIEIDGAVTVEMDFSTMQPSIMYGLADAEAPADSYTPDGWPADIRDFGKKAFNQIINAKPQMRHPNLWSMFAPDCLPDPLPADWAAVNANEQAEQRKKVFQERFGRPYTDLLNDLVTMHEPVSEHFFTGAWGTMQRLDSDIAERVMIMLLDAEVRVTALPIHDSFIVRRGAEWELFYAMHEAFEEIVGTTCNVDIDDTVYDPPEQDERNDDERKGLVFGADIHEEAKRTLIERSGYYRRIAEWEKVNGPVD